MSVWRNLLVSAVLVGLAAAVPVLASDALSAKGTCVACHLAKQKLVGPSWHDIAVKYKGKPDAPKKMFDVVRKGGKGVWGPLAMLPVGRDRISDAELTTLIAWTLKTP